MIHIGNVDNVITPELIEICTERANNFKTRGRDIDRIVYNTVIGEAVELLVCRYFNLHQVDFDIMEYDAIDKNGIRYEIKHTNKNEKWWNYNNDNYSYFLANAFKIDYIVLCYHDKNDGNVYLKFKADAISFNDFSSVSKFNNNHYYNFDIANRNNCCIIY